MSAGTDEILRRALNELIEREGRLEPFVDELASVRNAIKLLSKAIDGGPTAKRSPRLITGANSVATRGGTSPRAVFTQKCIEVVKASLEPMSAEQIAKAVGGSPSVYFDGILKKAVEKGQLEKRAGRYQIPSALKDKLDEFAQEAA